MNIQAARLPFFVPVIEGLKAGQERLSALRVIESVWDCKGFRRTAKIVSIEPSTGNVFVKISEEKKQSFLKCLWKILAIAAFFIILLPLKYLYRKINDFKIQPQVNSKIDPPLSRITAKPSVTVVPNVQASGDPSSRTDNQEDSREGSSGLRSSLELSDEERPKTSRGFQIIAREVNERHEYFHVKIGKDPIDFRKVIANFGLPRKHANVKVFAALQGYSGTLSLKIVEENLVSSLKTQLEIKGIDDLSIPVSLKETLNSLNQLKKSSSSISGDSDSQTKGCVALIFTYSNSNTRAVWHLKFNNLEAEPVSKKGPRTNQYLILSSDKIWESFNSLQEGLANIAQRASEDINLLAINLITNSRSSY
jgi:hypothetical protein